MPTIDVYQTYKRAGVCPSCQKRERSDRSKVLCDFCLTANAIRKRRRAAKRQQSLRGVVAITQEPLSSPPNSSPIHE